MELFPQAIFDFFARSLPVGHGFGDRPPIGACTDEAWRVCGVVTQDANDGSLGVLAMCAASWTGSRRSTTANGATR